MRKYLGIPVMIAVIGLLGGCSTISGLIDRFTGSQASKEANEEVLRPSDAGVRVATPAPLRGASGVVPQGQAPSAYPTGRDGVVVTNILPNPAVASALPQVALSETATPITGTPNASADAARQDPQALPPGTPQAIYFDFDSSALSPDGLSVVESYARILTADRTRRVVIEGHADERGGREYNLALGQKRAEAVLRALVMLGVSEVQLEAVSFGKERPAVLGSSEEAWAQNRRAELKPRQ